MNPKKTFFKFVIPSVLAFALSGVYAIVDGLFVGNVLGDSGLAAINLAYPITAFIQAFGTGIGLAGAIRCTILHARGDVEAEKACFGGDILLLLLSSLIITSVFLCLTNPILCLLGAEGAILTLAHEYTIVITLGAIFQILGTGLIPFIRNLGSATAAMLSMSAGFLTNIILDFLFVWVFSWGMAGAAVATIIGQGITMLCAVLVLRWKRVRISIPPIQKLPSIWGLIFKLSCAPFGLAFSPNITLVLMNRFLMMYGGGQSVAAYACIAYVLSIVYLLLQGVGDGSQPLISRYYGEQATSNLMKIRTLAYQTGGAIALVCAAGLFLTRGYVGRLFGASAAVSADVAFCLPIFLSSLLFLSFVRITTAHLYAMEQCKSAYLLVCAEPALLLMLLLSLPPAVGAYGVWIAVPVAQLFTWIAALIVKRRDSCKVAAAME